MMVKYFSGIANIETEDLYTMSKLMEDDGEPKRIVFTMAFYLLNNGQATFFVAYKKKKKVAYGLLVPGVKNTSFRRLKYFTVKRHLRNKGIGTEVLKEVISSEANLDAGFNLACSERNRAFYTRLGFEQIILERRGRFVNNDYITMSLHSDNCDVHDEDYGQFVDMKIYEPDAFPTYRNLEKMFDIQLMPEG